MNDLLRESNLYRLWLVLCAVYDDSILHRIMAGIGRWCNRQIDESAVLRVLCREGVVACSWSDSLLCRVLLTVLNFPGWLLHKLYLAFQPVFDDSFFARLAFSVGDETAVAESWMVMLLWVIPFAYWNNAYNLLGFLLLLLLF